MSLLPSNQPLIDQRFAEFIDRSSREEYESITTDPLVCHSSLLAHIAVGYDADISGMTEHEARLYLSTIERTKSIQGTAKAVEDTLSVTFQNAELVEWFEADDLQPSDFRVAVTVQADSSVTYDERKFALSRRLINQAKNVRSHLADFEVSLPESVSPVVLSGGVVMDARLGCELELGYETKFNLGGAVVWTF